MDMAEETQAVPTPSQAQDATRTNAPAQEASAPTQPPAAGTESANQQPQTKLSVEELAAELKSVRAEAAKYRTAAKREEERRKEEQEKQLQEQGEYRKLYEQAQAELTEIKSKLAAAERIELARKAADKAGIPAVLADRLRGDTLEDMVTDAQAIAATLPKPVLNQDARAGTGTPGAAQTLAGMTREQAAAFLNLRPEHLPKQ